MWIGRKKMGVVGIDNEGRRDRLKKKNEGALKYR